MSNMRFLKCIKSLNIIRYEKCKRRGKTWEFVRWKCCALSSLKQKQETKRERGKKRVIDHTYSLVHKQHFSSISFSPSHPKPASAEKISDWIELLPHPVSIVFHQPIPDQEEYCEQEDDQQPDGPVEVQDTRCYHYGSGAWSTFRIQINYIPLCWLQLTSVNYSSKCLICCFIVSG